MQSSPNFELETSQNQLEAIDEAIRSFAHSHQGDCLLLLHLLRTLESLHQEIRDGLFQQSLPDNRQALYSLLREIETEGGWPYIHRMRLQAFLLNLLPESSMEEIALDSVPLPASKPSSPPNL